MRIFKDLDLVEQLGSGIPRILQAYTKDCFHFSENSLRLVFPASEQRTPQVTPQVKDLLSIMSGVHSRLELQSSLQLLDRENFRVNYLQPAIAAAYIALTLPDKPTSSKQQYYLTDKGKRFINSL